MKTPNDLPSELRRAIWDSLDLLSLQNCLLVCRQWNKDIQSLAHKWLRICDQAKLQQVVDHYANSTTQARLVRDVVFNNGYRMDPKMLLELSSTFPNVKCVTLSPQKNNFRDDCASTWAALMQKWTKLTSINEFVNGFTSALQCFFTPSIGNNLLTSIRLQLNPCGRSLITQDVGTKIYQSAKQVIHLLQHCHALQHLTLKCTYLKPEDIDVLHRNTPRLVSLHLKILLLKRSVGDPAPRHAPVAVPATRIKELFFSTKRKCRGTLEERVHKDWLDYIAEKYPRLETLTFKANTREHNAHRRQQAHIKKLIKLVGNCLRLKTLHIAFIGGFTEALAKALDKSNIRLESANVNGNALSVIEQLKSLSKHQEDLKTLHILTPYLKEHEACGDKVPENVYALGGGMHLFPNLQHVVIKRRYGSLFSPYKDESRDYCSFQLLHSLLKYCKKLVSIRIEVGHAFKAFDDDMHLLSAAETLKELTIHNLKYGIQEINYLNNVILPNCPHLTAFSTRYGSQRLLNAGPYKETCPDVIHIKLTHQHQLETLSIGRLEDLVLLNILLPEESTSSAMLAGWFRRFGQKMVRHVAAINSDKHTVLYIQPECLDAFLSATDRQDVYHFSYKKNSWMTL